MKRYEILDGFRGYFLVFMLVNHLAFAGGSWIMRINHAELGFVQDAQGFIFISGLIVGLYYARGYMAGKTAAMDRKILGRAYLLWVYTIVILAAILGTAWLWPGSVQVWERYFHEFYRSPAVMASAAALLLYQPTFMDILPQYILYLLVSPLMIRLVLRGYAMHVLCGTLLLWFAVQLGLYWPLAAGIQALGEWVAPGFVLRAHFNPLGWQLVFMTGLLIGAAAAAGTLPLDKWFDPNRTLLLTVSFILLVMFMAIRVGFTLRFLPEVVAVRFIAIDHRGNFSFPYAVNFAALGYAVAWLLLCGDRARSAVLRRLHRGLLWLFALPFLRFIGKHSLQVYAYHVALIYLMFVVDWRYGPFPEWLKAAITLLGVASLLLPAWLHGLHKPLNAAAKPGHPRPANA